MAALGGLKHMGWQAIFIVSVMFSVVMASARSTSMLVHHGKAVSVTIEGPTAPVDPCSTMGVHGFKKHSIFGLLLSKFGNGAPDGIDCSPGTPAPEQPPVQPAPPVPECIEVHSGGKDIGISLLNKVSFGKIGFLPTKVVCSPPGEC